MVKPEKRVTKRGKGGVSLLKNTKINQEVHTTRATVEVLKENVGITEALLGRGRNNVQWTEQ